MRKILSLLFFMMVMAASSQTAMLCNNTRIARDTFFILPVTGVNTWAIPVRWSINTATLTYIHIEQSFDRGQTWAKYANLDSLQITGTSGSSTFTDQWCSGDALKVVVRIEPGSHVNLWVGSKLILRK